MSADINLGVRRFISALKSRVIMQSLIRLATFPCHYRQQTGRYVLCGWLRRAFSRPARLRRARSPVRTSPLASELPLTCEALPFAGGPSGPYLSGYARQLLTVRCAHYAGEASLTTFGFVTIVPRYLPKASNSLTFVRGAGRACCAPRERQRSLTCTPRKWLC